MAKIDPNFQYDAFKFVLSGVRSDEMEEFFGKSDRTNPERSIQGWFERIQARISELPRLLEVNFESSDLDQLLALTGWDSEIDFAQDLDEPTKRKLIALSVPLWKFKGTDTGLIGALRIFTGKTVILRNWFFHRWILDEAGFWYEDGGADPWLHGTRYTEEDDELQWLILNRTNVRDEDRELIYGLLTYLRTSGEHFGVVYAAFADDFGRGTPSEGSSLPQIPQWENVNEVGVEYNATLQKLEMFNTPGDNAIVRTRSPQDEIDTWGPTQRISAQILIGSDPTHTSFLFTMRGMISTDGTRHYGVSLDSSGNVQLQRNGINAASGTYGVPQDGTQFGVELQIEPIDAATVRVTVLIGARELLTQDFIGSEAYDEPGGGIELLCDDGGLFVDNVVVLATPNRVQYIGQKPITPTLGLGGPSYIADPAPGVEEFEG